MRLQWRSVFLMGCASLFSGMQRLPSSGRMAVPGSGGRADRGKWHV
ncbi:MAG: hypothetical protein L0312_12220 [Acidobacteria bacterium]|nr:hypothetical protein [Acidobacteriota bacterium]